MTMESRGAAPDLGKRDYFLSVPQEFLVRNAKDFDYFYQTEKNLETIHNVSQLYKAYFWPQSSRKEECRE